jgi:tetratricopeptide (TPR) repeat protein
MKLSSDQSIQDLPQQIVNIIGECAANDKDLNLACEILSFLHDSFPLSIEITCQFSNNLIKSGQLGKAKSILEQTNLLSLNNPNLLTQLAIVESELGNSDRAESIHLRLVQNYPDHFLSNFNYALFLSMIGRNDEAYEFLNRCLQIVPDAPEALAAMNALPSNKNSLLAAIYGLIESKMYDEAVLQLQSAKSIIDPIFYWAAISDIPAAASSTIEDVGLVSPFDQIEIFDFFNSLDEKDVFLVAIEDYIKSQESLIWDRAGKPTRFGKQSHEILNGSNDQYINDLSLRLKRHILDYMNTRPFLAQIASQKNIQYELSGWAVSLANGGYQKRHIHPEAIVSGVFYIKLSDESRSEHQIQGNLSFPSSHCSRMITPKEGMVVLFPSYLPHETIPLIKDHERVCIAFNLV